MLYNDGTLCDITIIIIGTAASTTSASKVGHVQRECEDKTCSYRYHYIGIDIRVSISISSHQVICTDMSKIVHKDVHHFKVEGMVSYLQ